MLKRSGTIVLTLLYMVTVIGFAINLHYCGKIITGVKVDAPAKVCSLASSKMKCCRDKQIDIKIKDAHQTAAPSILGKIFSFQVAGLPYHHGGSFPSQTAATQSFCDKAPPDAIYQYGTPAFIKNCIFRI